MTGNEASLEQVQMTADRSLISCRPLLFLYGMGINFYCICNFRDQDSEQAKNNQALNLLHHRQCLSNWDIQMRRICHACFKCNSIHMCFRSYKMQTKV